MDYLKLFQTHEEYETFVSGGTMVRPNVSHCVQENEVHYNPIIHDYSQDYLTFVALEDGTFKLSDNSVSYSLDEGKTWMELAADTYSPTVTAGNKIMWKGELWGIEGMVGKFGSTGLFNAQGNVMSLLFGDNFNGQKNLSDKDVVFFGLFGNYNNVLDNYYNTCKIVNAKNLSLPAITLAESCYSDMFIGCTSLITAPELPATTLAYNCYDYMFAGCESLTTAPELPATTLAVGCYGWMFDGCTSLVNAPVLPATTLAQQCYQWMFHECTSLTAAPELPSTTLAESCYSYMFNGCTSLTTVPSVLPATTLANGCYQYMFFGCASLTTAPELPAITLVESCYESMFYDCASLNYIKAMFTTTPNGTHTAEWVNGVASTGTFVKNSAAQWDVTGVNGVPNGWTVQTATA